MAGVTITGIKLSCRLAQQYCCSAHAELKQCTETAGPPPFLYRVYSQHKQTVEHDMRSIINSSIISATLVTKRHYSHGHGYCYYSKFTC